MIFTWDKNVCIVSSTSLTLFSKTEEYVTNILNFHRDAIQTLLPIPRAEEDGWIVWTGSSDRTINVIFVPTEYTEELHHKGYSEREKEEIQKMEEKLRETAEQDKKKQEEEEEQNLRKEDTDERGKKLLPRVCSLSWSL